MSLHYISFHIHAPRYSRSIGLVHLVLDGFHECVVPLSAIKRGGIFGQTEFQKLLVIRCVKIGIVIEERMFEA